MLSAAGHAVPKNRYWKMFHPQKPCSVISNVQEPSFRMVYIDYKAGQ